MLLKYKFTLNTLVITIMLAVVGFISLFIYGELNLKDRMIYHLVQKAELEAELLGSAVSLNLQGAHSADSYDAILDYGDFIGVEDIGIYKVNGEEAFQGGAQGRRIGAGQSKDFKKAIKSMNSVDSFDHNLRVFTRFTPLMSGEEKCISCHTQEDEVLGILKSTFSTQADFELLDWVTQLIWALGIIMVLTLAGLLLSGAIIREKNKIYAQLEDRSETLENTYHSLAETKSYLQMILDYSKAIIITTDLTGHVVEFNREAELLTGYSKSEMVGRKVLGLCADSEQKKDIIHTLKKAQKTGNKVWEVKNQEVEIKTKSGDHLYVSATFSPLMDTPEKAVGAVVVCKDISEHVKLQFKLMQSEKLAGIGTLASGVAHEINNPLAGILGMAEAARDEDDLTTSRSYLDYIIRYTLDASNIVKELAAYSRTAGTKSKTAVDLSIAMEDALKMSGHSAPFKSIKVNSNLETGSYISANAGELQQIFVNLIVNAIHAMGKKGRLTLKCFHKKDRVIAVVSDTGSGISKRHLGQIYDPFFTTKPAGEGTGLGLYVVYKLVTKYGGSFDCTSTEGKGTSFTLGFPAFGEGGREST